MRFWENFSIEIHLSPIHSNYFQPPILTSKHSMSNCADHIFADQRCALRTPTLTIEENGVLQQQWLATTCFWAEVLGCEVVVGTLEKRLSHFARPSTYHGPIGSCPKTAKKRQNPSCGKKQPTPRPKWERTAGTSNQLQKPARNTCGHALARFWWPGPVQQVTQEDAWVCHRC